jgi:hypothetical protein
MTDINMNSNENTPHFQEILTRTTQRLRTNTTENVTNISNIVYNANPTNLVSVKAPANPPTRCFDPIELEETGISNDYAVFYVFDETDALRFTSCLDEFALNQYKSDEDLMFFECKQHVSTTALQITKQDVLPRAFRLLNLSMRVYVKERQAQMLQKGKRYALRPVRNLGRIASAHVVRGDSVIGRNHCGPPDGSKLYDIQEMRQNGGGIKSRRVSRRAKFGKHSSRSHPKPSKRKCFTKRNSSAQ